MGLFGGDEKALEQQLADVKRQRHQNNAGIHHAVFQQLPLGPQQNGNGADKDKAQRRDDHAQPEGHIDKEGKIPVGPLTVPLAEGLGHNGGAAGAEHKAHGGHDHKKGNDEVHRCKGGLARKIGDKKAIHHPVDGGEHHHGDGRQRKTDESFVGEMIGQLNFHGLLPNQSKANRPTAGARSLIFQSVVFTMRW